MRRIAVIAVLLAACSTSAGGAADAALECRQKSFIRAADRACTSAADCVAVLHEADCCGTIVALGVAADARAHFDADEQACRATYPLCMCAPQEMTTDDGSFVLSTNDVAVTCAAGLCTTVRAACDAQCDGAP